MRFPRGVTKVVPPLEPLAIRPISPRFLSKEERVRIADMASRGDGPTVIAQALGRSASTISRELRRNLHPTGQYRPFHAHVLAAQRRRRPKQPKLAGNAWLRGFVTDRLAQRWSPQQISRALRTAHPDEPALRLSTESRALPPGDRPVVGVKHGPGQGSSGGGRGLQCGLDEFGAQVVGDRPADEPAALAVDHGGQVEVGAVGDRQVRDVPRRRGGSPPGR